MASSDNANSYGTISNANGRPNGNAGAAPHDDESGPLLGSKSRPGVVQKTHRHFSANVTKKRGDLALLACYVITGLLDSCSVSTWGSFVSMQTGNTVYVGLGIVAPTESNRWMRSGVSILFFCLGSAFFAFFHRRLGQRKRWTMVSSYVLQLLLIIAAASMVTFGPRTGTSGPVTVWIAVPIALIAFQSAGQAVVSRAIQYGSLTSVVLTSIYCDLFSDPNFFATPRQNVERNRRAAAPILLLVGAVLGGLFAHSSLGLAGALWTAAALKLLVVIAWAFWPAEAETD